MANKLQQRFPMIRSREQILLEIQENEHLRNEFRAWEPEQQELFLDIFTGAAGVKMLYDGYFKIVLDPEVHPERLERILSLLLQQQVKILTVLPNEGVKIADEGSLLIMDIVVRLADGSIANVECQKNGYAFPGQRAACYSADLLMRQYRREKKESAKAGRKFSYRDIKSVYTIIFYEKSPSEFRNSSGCYIHRSGQVLDSGIPLELLQKFVFVNLDIYFEIHQNSNIENEMDAWLMFLGTDDPDRIVSLLDQYPWFENLYRDLYTACCNTEKVMDMFSEELRILDRNTAQYMIDEMEAEIRKQGEQLKEKDAQIEEKDAQIEERDAKLQEKTNQLESQNLMLEKISRSLVEECRGQGKSRAEAERMLCDRMGMDPDLARKAVQKFWEKK